MISVGQRRQGGFILLMVLALLAIGSMLTAAFYTMLHIGLADAYQHGRQQIATNLADAGLEKALASLRTDSKYAGETDTPLGGGAFSITVTPGTAPRTWTVVSTGVYGTPKRGYHAKARTAADIQLDGQGRVLALYLREDGPCK